MSELLIRRAVPEDIPRVVRWWLNSFKTSRWAGVVPNNKYNLVYAETIRQLLSRGASLEVACLKETPSLLAGFICFELTPRDRILHYVFVRPHLRRGGVATRLVDSCFVGSGASVYTFKTRDSRWVVPEGIPHMPELARRKEAYKEPPVPVSDTSVGVALNG